DIRAGLTSEPQENTYSSRAWFGSIVAPKEAVEALPTVKINENLQCSVCLDDFEVGSEANEMQCKHRFHNACILLWLELHSSCPVCRYQLRVDEPKQDSDVSRNRRNQKEDENIGHADAEGGSEGRSPSGGRRFTFPWPLNGLFSSSSSSSSSNGNDLAHVTIPDNSREDFSE
ncbi:E3 ubiquitin-protein ligase ring1-like protein, partial [Trifolium pratense]